MEEKGDILGVETGHGNVGGSIFCWTLALSIYYQALFVIVSLLTMLGLVRFHDFHRYYELNGKLHGS